MTPPPPETPEILINHEGLTAARKRAGLTSDPALATAMGTHRATVYRTLTGRAAIGASFVARLMCALPRAKFDDLFVIPAHPKAAKRTNTSDEAAA